jgi:peptidylprolyl isomerase
MVQAKIGDTVKVHYTGRLDDGSTFDTSMHCYPLEFTLGDGELIPGFEKAVLGMNPGDTKTAIIPAEQAYGAHRPEMVIEVDRQHLPPTFQPYVGQRLQMTQQDGTPVPVLVMAVTDAQVTLDANHPLARKDRILPPSLPSNPNGPTIPHPAAPVQHQPKPRCTACSAWLRGALAGGRGDGAKKDVWISYTLGGERPRLIRRRLRQLGSLWGLCPARGEFVLRFVAIVTGCSTEQHGRAPPKSVHSCGNFFV